MCYKCNNLGHIALNCHALDDQLNPRREYQYVNYTITAAYKKILKNGQKVWR